MAAASRFAAIGNWPSLQVALEQIEQEAPLPLLVAHLYSDIGDPLGKLTLTDENFDELTKLMLQAAADHCHDRLISVLEGGYNLSGLASAVTAHVGAMV